MKQGKTKAGLVFLLILVILVFVSALPLSKAEGADFFRINKNFYNPFFNKIEKGMANPAAIYCEELGYEYEIVDGQSGICKFPDNSECEEWTFLKGQCGQEFSYCAQQGYDIITKDDGQNSLSVEYAVCILNGDEVGSVTELMNLGELATIGESTPKNIPEPIRWNGQSYQGFTLPPSIDWRNYQGSDWMTPVKDQGTCGSCWAFSAVGAVEAKYNIDTGNPNFNLDLSEQQLTSGTSDPHDNCCWLCGNCGGGWPSSALNFIESSGIVDERCFPYTAQNSPCNLCYNWQNRLKFIDESIRIPENHELLQQALVEKGPLSVCLGIGSPYGGYWNGDIYRCSNDSGANHCVVLVGYDNDGEYWIIKNSWGSSWNNDGYYKLGYGECHLTELRYVETPATPTPIACGDTITNNVRLTNDLLDCSGNGLVIGANNITLDCNHHLIDGDNSGGGAGIRIESNKQGVTIKNCNIQEFENGISLKSSFHNILIYNNINNNSNNGILLEYSSYNALIYNTVNGNHRGIYLKSYSTNNELINNKACMNDYEDLKCDSSGNTGSENQFDWVEGCPDVTYNDCYVCGGNYCGEGDGSQEKCEAITNCPTAWGLVNGDSMSGCWRNLCCGDDSYSPYYGEAEAYVVTNINNVDYEACCNTATDCVDATGTCRIGIEIHESCNNGIDDDCDGLFDCDDPDCEEDWRCGCDEQRPCPVCYRCSNGHCGRISGGRCMWNKDCCGSSERCVNNRCVVPNVFNEKSQDLSTLFWP